MRKIVTQFGFIKLPDHLHDELLKLHGVTLKGQNIVIEKASSTSETTYTTTICTPPRDRRFNTKF